MIINGRKLTKEEIIKIATKQEIRNF